MATMSLTEPAWQQFAMQVFGGAVMQYPHLWKSRVVRESELIPQGSNWATLFASSSISPVRRTV